MKVCHIHKFYYPGFGITEFNQFTKYTAQFGLDVIVISKGKSSDKTEEMINNIKIKRIAIDDVSFPTLTFLKEASKIIKNEKFNIVHTYFFRGCGVLPLLCPNKKIKFLLDIRSGNIRGGIISNLANLVTKLESFGFDAVSTLDENLTKRIFGKSKREKYFIFPMGVDLNLFKKKISSEIKDKLCLRPNDSIILYCGHTSPLRKLHIVIEGFYNALKKRQNLKLMFIGDGPDTPRLRKIAESLGIAERVLFTGFIKYEDVPSYLSAGDIAVSFVPITQEFDIQPPTKTLEYLACGLPTIATDTKGNRRFIKNRYNGLLIKDNASSLERAIIELLDNHKLRETIISNSGNFLSEYDWKNIVKNKIMPAYKILLEN